MRVFLSGFVLTILFGYLIFFIISRNADANTMQRLSIQAIATQVTSDLDRAMPMINEAIETLYTGVAGVEEIDTVMKLGMAHPMGPLQLADFIGLDVCLSILNVMYDGFKNPKYAPCPLLVNMVMAKKLGIKSKEGFYDYSESRKAEIVSAQFR